MALRIGPKATPVDVSQLDASQKAIADKVSGGKQLTLEALEKALSATTGPDAEVIKNIIEGHKNPKPRPIGGAQLAPAHQLGLRHRVEAGEVDAARGLPAG